MPIPKAIACVHCPYRIHGCRTTTKTCGIHGTWTGTTHTRAATKCDILPQTRFQRPESKVNPTNSRQASISRRPQRWLTVWCGGPGDLRHALKHPNSKSHPRLTSRKMEFWQDWSSEGPAMAQRMGGEHDKNMQLVCDGCFPPFPITIQGLSLS